VTSRLGNSVGLRSKNRCAALENLNDRKNINWAWENINEHIKSSDKGDLGLHELKVEILAYFN
jgi:hypothetical protein